MDNKVAKEAAKAGIAGLEFYAGIPGTIGGALRMNAGCYGGETKDVLGETVAIDRRGRRGRPPMRKVREEIVNMVCGRGSYHAAGRQIKRFATACR